MLASCPHQPDASDNQVAHILIYAVPRRCYDALICSFFSPTSYTGLTKCQPKGTAGSDNVIITSRVLLLTRAYPSSASLQTVAPLMEMEKRGARTIRRRRRPGAPAAAGVHKEVEGIGPLQSQAGCPLPRSMVPPPTHRFTTSSFSPSSSTEAFPASSPRRTRIRRDSAPLSFPLLLVILLPCLLLPCLFLHVTSAMPPPPSPSLPPPGFLVPILPFPSSSPSFISRHPTHPTTISHATKPSSSSSSSPSPVSSAPTSATTTSKKNSSGKNSSDPSLLDLVGFRAGLDESYRLKRQSALLTLSGQEEGAKEEGGGGRGGGLGGDRKPWGYWKDISQIKTSVEEFWEGLNISSSAIPNEMLLRLYDAHGLRHAIYKQGGRETLAYLLGTDYIPGDFRQAMSFPEVQALVAAGVIVPHADPQSQALLSPLPPSNTNGSSAASSLALVAAPSS